MTTQREHVKLFTASDLIEAQVVEKLLSAEGIDAFIKNESLQSGLGELPFVEMWPEIWLTHSRDCERAQKLLMEFINRPAAKEWTCPTCKELNPGTFDVCWACVQPLADEEDGFTA